MKKLLSFSLCVLMLTSSSVSAFASTTLSDAFSDAAVSMETYSESTPSANFDTAYPTKIETLDDAIKYTISFPSARELETAMEADNAKNIDDKSRDLINTSAAKAYVSSLNLSSGGWECIEKACLEQLDSLAAESDGTLISYSVLVPSNSNGSIAQPTSTSITSFGSYNGVQFYSNIYSSYTKEYKKNSITARDKIKSWGSGAIDLVLCFATPQVTVPFTVIKTAMGAPASYTVKDSAYVDYYFNLISNCRGIYSKNTNGSYRMLTSSEKGSVAPAVLFHPVDGNYPTLITKNFSKKAVATSSYDDRNWQLQVAYNQYSNNAYGNDPFSMKLSTIAQSATWQ